MIPFRFKQSLCVWPSFIAVALAALFAQATLMAAEKNSAALLEIRHGDHICFVGNTLADRMQHDGWLETMLQNRFPEHELVICNLGFSGDELTLRLRSANFGSPDEHLSLHRADVIFAFFGYNESFGGAAGLGQFKKDLASFIAHTLGQHYNGKSSPRLVLLSPIAHENLHDRNLPDGTDNNKRLALYTAAMAEVALAHRVPFVDLFAATRALYAQGSGPLTINGIHLNKKGNWLIGRTIDRALFPTAAALPERPTENVEKLQQAVLDKNFCFFNRYRTVDGYSIYGGRADLKFVGGQTNRDVMVREMEILDVMTANRDKRIWALAQGHDIKVDDSNLPSYIAVQTNKPGEGPHGAHVYLDGEQAIQKMTVAQGMQINLFASEKEFPLLEKPVQMAFDPQGRLWVAVWPSYPHWKPGDEVNDKLLVFEDTKGTGKADRCTVFADHLHCPTGFEFYNGGVLLAQAPGVVFLKDTKGTGKADLCMRMLDGIDSADTHHTANSFQLDPGGALYFQEGTFHHTQVETPYGPPVRCANAGVYRYEPRTQKFEVYITHAFANPHGHVFDSWGQDLVVDGTGSEVYHAALFSGHLDYPEKHARPPRIYQQRTRPCPGVEILSSRHFPAENQGNLLVANVIGFQGILQYRIHDNGASFSGTEVEPIVSSTDPNFRPSDLKMGPDGALYFLDWQNTIIGHMQHNLRDPSRDKTHGRIYRVTCTDRPLVKPVKIAGASIEQLLDVLKDPEDRVRYRARIELGGRNGDEVIAAGGKWVSRLNSRDPGYEHHLLEALWAHQYHNVVDADLLRRVLGAGDFRARAAATRVLCYWRDRIPQALPLLRGLAADPSPRVRLEAVRAASFFRVPEAMEVVLIASAQPHDPFVDFVCTETMRALRPFVQQAFAESRPIAFANPQSARPLVKMIGTDDLLQMKRNDDVYRELLSRKGVPDDYRQEALTALARSEHEAIADVLLDTIREEDQQVLDKDQGAIFDLFRLLGARNPSELVSLRGALEKLATTSKRPLTRQLGFVTLISADGGTNRAWQLASSAPTALEDFVNAVSLLPDPSERAALYAKLQPLIEKPPSASASASAQADPAIQIRIRHAAMMAMASVRGQEAQTFKALARFIGDSTDRQAVVNALSRIPVANWPREEAAPLLQSLLAYIRSVPLPERTAPAARNALLLAQELAGLLPPDQAKRVRSELGGLGVRVLRLATVPEQMIYDQDRIIVGAGKPVEIDLQNNDLMPHNFVLTQPGALEEIGMLAEAAATQPGALERQYVPQSSKIVLASRLVQPRTSLKLSFKAPAQPGVYPYVCTYPGHWRRMHGAMYVVDDLEECLANPEVYLARHPLPIADELLKFNRPRHEWRFEDLAAAVERMDQRSYGNGKQMFQVASCIACHRMNGVGTEIGPDLVKLDPKRTPVEVLRDIIEPSLRINEKYQSFTFETGSGRVVTGLVLEENSDVVKVIENPLAKSEPVVLKRSDILERRKLSTSIMPKGLLDKLTQDEILDLVAYIAARGDPHSAVFQQGHDHAHHAGHRH
jgi:putative heme-binding domain-containing protein